jgi:hypothetical protein
MPAGQSAILLDLVFGGVFRSVVGDGSDADEDILRRRHVA